MNDGNDEEKSMLTIIEMDKRYTVAINQTCLIILSSKNSSSSEIKLNFKQYNKRE